MDLLLTFRGETAALAGALLWAIASTFFERLGKQVPPLLLNFLKGAVAIALIALTLIVLRSPLPELGGRELLALGLSGAIGLGLGDTAFFKSLNALGARRALLFETLAPPLSALLALVFLAETLPAPAWVGIALTMAGVATAIADRTARSPGERRQWRTGIGWALLAALSQASGATLSRAVLVGADLDPLWSALLRLTAGTLCLLPFLGQRPPRPVQPIAANVVADFERFRAPSPLRSPRLLAGIAVTAVLGTYLGIWLQQTALKFAPTGIAQTLMATSPIFALAIALGAGARVGGRAWFGAGIAIAGVYLLFQT